MDALQRALGNYRGYLEISSSRTLTVDDLGKYIYVNGSSAVTLTLPKIATLTTGATYHIQCAASCPSVSIVSQNGIFSGPNSQSSIAATLVMNSATGLSLTCSSLGWFAHNGSGGAYLEKSGYQRLPSGLIIQWGAFTVTASNTFQDFNLPIAFPNGSLS